MSEFTEVVWAAHFKNSKNLKTLVPQVFCVKINNEKKLLSCRLLSNFNSIKGDIIRE